MFAATLTAPTNFDLMARRSSCTGPELTVKNFRAINIGDLKAFKVQKLAGSKA